MRNSLRIGFGIALAGALALGATQALAAPSTVEARSWCHAFQCRASCELSGYSWGQCVDGYCECS